MLALTLVVVRDCVEVDRLVLVADVAVDEELCDVVLLLDVLPLDRLVSERESVRLLVLELDEDELTLVVVAD